MAELIETNGNGAVDAPLLQPHNLEAEESVLGAMMVSEAAIDPVVSDARLKAEDFYRSRHGIVYEAIHELYSRNDPVDALTVSELLRSQGKLDEAGGRDAIATLASNTPVPGNAGHYAQIVKQNSMLRRLLGAAQRIQQSVHAREGEPQDLVEQAEKLLFNVARAEQAGDFASIASILDAETERLHKLASGDSSMTGTPSGFKRLDDITGGFQPGNLIVLAARPAMGKSSFVCNVAENVAWKARLPVAFFSLEMSETELAHRFIASRARIASDRLRKGQVSKDWSKVLKACNELAEAPLWIDDSSDLSLLDLRAKCRRLHSSAGGLGLVIVDYIQLMRAEEARINRVEQVGQMSRGLKILARELAVPVIALSQLSRAPEQRTGKEKGIPMLSDLRESGCLTGHTRVHLPDSGGWTTMEKLAATERDELPRVLALNERTMKLEPARVANAFSTGTKPVFRLTTKLGRTIRATGNHRFRAFEGWRRLDELGPGDMLAVPRRLPPGRGSEMTQPEAALLGHLIGDGCTLQHHTIQYTTNDEALAGTGVSTRVMQQRIGTRYCGSALYRANLSRSRAGRVATAVGSDRLRTLAMSDVYWDPIVSIEPDGAEEVYDLTVEGHHNFVADDLVVHNSLEQDADIVAFIYRDEYYHPEDTERPGEADLIIAKHRNGPIGKVPLVFQDQFPKFVSMTTSAQDDGGYGGGAA